MSDRRCNRLCWDAKGRDCACWCRGAFHGKGTVRAAQLLSERLGINPELIRTRRYLGVPDPGSFGDGPLFDFGKEKGPPM